MWHWYGLSSALVFFFPSDLLFSRRYLVLKLHLKKKKKKKRKEEEEEEEEKKVRLLLE